MIMEDMRQRIDRGDIMEERAEAIKVLFPVLRSDELVNTIQGNV